MPGGRDDDEPRLNPVLAGLDAINFPPLDRPAVRDGTPPTQELVEWAMRFYASVLLSHVRQLLRTFLVAVRDGQTPGAFVLGRAIFELGAHATLVYGKLVKRQEARDLPGAWEVFARATMGNREMRERGELTSTGEEWTAPFHVADAIREVNTFFAGTGRDEQAGDVMYDTLSEHSHPNQGAFSQYYRFEKCPEGTRTVFLTLREDYSPPPFPEVALAIVLSIDHAAMLFERGGDHHTASLLRPLLEELDERPQP